MLLTELLDYNKPVDIVVNTERRFETKLGSILFGAIKAKSQNSWGILFADVTDGRFDYEMTGKGNELQTLGFVLASLKELIKQRHPRVIEFSAEKEISPGKNSNARSAVYSRMLKRIDGYDVAKLSYTIRQVYTHSKKFNRSSAY